MRKWHVATRAGLTLRQNRLRKKGGAGEGHTSGKMGLPTKIKSNKIKAAYKTHKIKRIVFALKINKCQGPTRTLICPWSQEAVKQIL